MGPLNDDAQDWDVGQILAAADAHPRISFATTWHDWNRRQRSLASNPGTEAIFGDPRVIDRDEVQATLERLVPSY